MRFVLPVTTRLGSAPERIPCNDNVGWVSGKRCGLMALLKMRIGRTKGRGKDCVLAGCPHDQRDPRWDSMADAGKTDRIDHYICRSCGQKLVEDTEDRSKPP